MTCLAAAAMTHWLFAIVEDRKTNTLGVHEPNYGEFDRS
jgi:hypothetical protein